MEKEKGIVEQERRKLAQPTRAGERFDQGKAGII
jgi:hypothetical protein